MSLFSYPTWKNILYLVPILLLLLSSSSCSRISAKNSLFVSTQKIAQMNKEYKKYLPVDIRDRANFAKIYAPGSINVNPAFLVSRNFLRTKNVILIYRDIKKPAAIFLKEEAMSKGFRSVRVLEGGITAWIEAGNETQGLSGIRKELYQVDPGELYLTYENDPGSFAILPMNDREHKVKSFAKTRILQDEENGEKSTATIKGLGEELKTARKQTSLPLVVIDADGTMKKKILLATKSQKLKQVFILR